MAIRNSEELNVALLSLFEDLKAGNINYKVAHEMTLAADKVNRNNMNAIEYKKVSNHNKELLFFSK